LISEGKLTEAHGKELLKYEAWPGFVDAFAEVIVEKRLTMADITAPGFFDRDDIAAALKERGVDEVPVVSTKKKNVPKPGSSDPSPRPATVDEIRQADAAGAAEISSVLAENPAALDTIASVFHHDPPVMRAPSETDTAQRIIAYLLSKIGGTVTVPNYVFVNDDVKLVRIDDIDGRGMRLRVENGKPTDRYGDAALAMECAAQSLPPDTPASYLQAITRTVKWLGDRAKAKDDAETSPGYSSGNIPTPEPVAEIGNTVKVDGSWIEQLAAADNAKAITAGKSLPPVKGVRFAGKLYCPVAIYRGGYPLVPNRVDAYLLIEPDMSMSGDEPVVFDNRRDDPFDGIHVRFNDRVLEISGPRVSFVLEGE